MRSGLLSAATTSKDRWSPAAAANSDALRCGSASTTMTRPELSAKTLARLMAVVVLPTPPFWLQTATIHARRFASTSSGMARKLLPITGTCHVPSSEIPDLMPGIVGGARYGELQRRLAPARFRAVSAHAASGDEDKGPSDSLAFSVLPALVLTSWRECVGLAAGKSRS